MSGPGDIAELLRARRAAYVQLIEAIRVLRAGPGEWEKQTRPAEEKPGG